MLVARSDGFEDLIRGFGPHEGLRILVVEGEVVANRLLELTRTAMRAATDLLLRERREPPLDEIEPQCPCRCEVQMEARMAREPAVDARRLVRAVVVENQMHIEVCRARSHRSCPGTSGTRSSGDGDGVARSHVRSPRRGPRRATWSRGARSRGFAARAALDASARAAAIDPVLGSGTSRRRRARVPSPAGSGRARRRRAPSRRTRGRSRA